MSYGLEELSSRFFDGVAVKHLKRFYDVVTPMGNVLEGVICRAHNHYLGSLVITKVNGVEVCQFVQSMPKIHYPDEHTSDLNMGMMFAYEKLDGTCIIMYPLLNQDNEVLEILYKTRGTVVADKHILRMVKQCNTKRYKTIICKTPSYKFYFELYGMENLHTIQHNRIIDMNEIAVSSNNTFISLRSEGNTVRKLFSIMKIRNTYQVATHNAGNLYGYLPLEPYCSESLLGCYRWIADALEDCNNQYVKDYGHPVIEGVVVQGYDKNNNHHFYKIKPKTIKSGCYDSGKVPVNSIRKEILKLFDEYSLEDIKEKTLEDNTWYLDIVNENLKEEFTIELIMDSQKRIKRLFQNIWEWKTPAKGDNDIAQDLVKKYPNMGVKELMRKFSTEYPHKKARSSKIYQILTHLVRT